MDYQKITLTNGEEVTLDINSRHTRCYKCKLLIKFAVTSSSRLIPIYLKQDGWHSHLAECVRQVDDERIESEERNQNYLNSL